jgi:hypothetical protein
MFGQKLWDEPSHSINDQNWFTAVQNGEQAIDEWIRKIIENPQILERVKYSKVITRDRNRRSKSLIHS